MSSIQIQSQATREGRPVEAPFVVAGASVRGMELRGAQVVLRPLAPSDAPALIALHASPEVARWWGPPEPGFPLADDDDSVRFTVWVDGTIAGMIQYCEEPEPSYRYAAIDVFLGAEWQGRGLGTDTLTTLVRHLEDGLGHGRLTIDPATDNPAAIRCYERAGFTPVGVMRAYSRVGDTGPWCDGLLMERVRRA
jgi:aminoglycoside 6'-N-acetyltransferase